MLRGAEGLGVPVATSGVVLPLAVAIFRVTGPPMNLAVAIYVAYWFGVPLGPAQLAAGVAVAAITTMGAVSLPGQISFVTSIAPICIAMGVPVAPLGLLVAVETIPDIFRTLGNVDDGSGDDRDGVGAERARPRDRGRRTAPGVERTRNLHLRGRFHARHDDGSRGRENGRLLWAIGVPIPVIIILVPAVRPLGRRAVDLACSIQQKRRFSAVTSPKFFTAVIAGFASNFWNASNGLPHSFFPLRRNRGIIAEKQRDLPHCYR